jgi:hypothetical protein
MNKLMYIFIIGIGATAVMDLWGVIRKPLLGIRRQITLWWGAGSLIWPMENSITKPLPHPRQCVQSA